jgi:NAD(P)-dependent dehydrogenase (short-subunit alcohol dehydrogenase family)
MKTVLVTGCGGGLGVELCSAFRAADYRVVGTDRRACSADCDRFIQIDLADACPTSDRFERAVKPLRDAINGNGLAALVNNAAVQILDRTKDISFAAWHESVAVNLTVPFLLTQALLPELEQGHGTVVNIGSVHARATKPRFVAYASTKSALVGLTRALAVDLAPAVRVLAINPGAIDTPMLREGFANRPEAIQQLAEMHPLRRIATPQEVARFVVFLASDASGFATGAAIDIDGGILSRLHDPE